MPAAKTEQAMPANKAIANTSLLRMTNLLNDRHISCSTPSSQASRLLLTNMARYSTFDKLKKRLASPLFTTSAHFQILHSHLKRQFLPALANAQKGRPWRPVFREGWNRVAMGWAF